MAETDLTKMLPAELVEALIKDNSLASEFDKLDLWKKFRYRDWSNLLSSQPQFADKCPDKMYDQFSQEQWAELEAQHSGVFGEKHMLSTLRKLAK